MAKIFRTEELSINGDEIRISAPLNSDDLVFNKVNAQGQKVEITTLSSLMLRDVGHDSDISSLSKVSTNLTSDTTDDLSSLEAQIEGVRDTDLSSLESQIEGVRDTDLSSLESQIEGVRDTDLSSLESQIEGVRDTDLSSLESQIEGVRDTDLSSLESQIEDARDADLSSLQAIVETNDVVSRSATIEDGMQNGSYDATEARVTVTFGRTFTTAPNVVGIMKAAAGNPIIGVQLISTTTTQAVFQLSDDVAVDGTYTIEVLASV